MKYKNILWIDDCDDGDSSYDDDFLEIAEEQKRIADEERGRITNEQQEIIKTYFPYDYKNVKLITEFKRALGELEKNNIKYDLVVFDINFQLEIDFDDFEYICNILNKKRVYVSEKNNFEEFKKIAGIYLYLYLLNCGYPNNRMAILTGNGSGSIKEFLKAAHIEVIDDSDNEQRFIFYRSGGKLNKYDIKWIDLFYKNEYYQIRRLVYKACEYWKEILNFKEKKDIAFNDIYYPKKKAESSVEKEVFISMLERIEMLFPIAEPENKETIYYQALQVATMFHEESADISSIKSGNPIRGYHQAIRNFRNWSAHNKFNQNKIPADIFAYLFCITLRSYFQTKECQFTITEQGNECYRIYEKEFFDKFSDKNLDIKEFKNMYIQDFKKHINKIRDIKDKFSCGNLDNILLKSGRVHTSDDKEKMNFKDLLLSVIDDLIIQDNTPPIEKSVENNLEYTIKYYWDTNINIKDIDKKDFFKYMAYQLYVLE